MILPGGSCRCPREDRFFVSDACTAGRSSSCSVRSEPSSESRKTTEFSDTDGDTSAAPPGGINSGRFRRLSVDFSRLGWTTTQEPNPVPRRRRQRLPLEQHSGLAALAGP